MGLSSNWLGRWILIPVVGVRVPAGLPNILRKSGAEVEGVDIPACHAGGSGCESRQSRQI